MNQRLITVTSCIIIAALAFTCAWLADIRAKNKAMLDSYRGSYGDQAATLELYREAFQPYYLEQRPDRDPLSVSDRELATWINSMVTNKDYELWQ